MTVNFDIDQLEPGIAAEGEVDAEQTALMVAYSQAISLRRIADLLEQRPAATPAPVTVGPAGAVALVRGGRKAVGAAAPVVKAQALPAEFIAWAGQPRQVGEENGRKLVGPVDALADVVVWYRRGRVSNRLSAGQVNWSHTGGPDDVLGYRVVGAFADRVGAGEGAEA